MIKPHIGEATGKLMGLLSQPDARAESNEDATDNAVSALGKICLKHADATDVSQVLPHWLEYQPLKADLEEAAVCHNQLCALLESNSALVLGVSVIPAMSFPPECADNS